MIKISTDLDTTIILRALSIVAIVAGHFHVGFFVGGAFFLIALAGFNFVRYTLPKINLDEPNGFSLTHFFSTYFNFVKKIIIPTCLYLTFVYVVLGEFHVYGLLLVSNFIGPGYANGLSFWFIEVLIQIYIVFSLIFLFYPLRNFLRKNTFIFFLSITILSYLFRTMSLLLFDTSDLLNRLPHLMLYMFAIGGTIALSDSISKKLITSCLVVFVSLQPLITNFGDKYSFLFFSCLAILWMPVVTVPKLLANIFRVIAMSSLFIYLVHFQARSMLQKVWTNPPPLVSVVFAIFVGITCSYLWKRRKSYLVIVKGFFYKKNIAN